MRRISFLSRIAFGSALLVLIGSTGLRPLNAGAAVSFSAGIEITSPADFYDPLSGLGVWFDLPSYGRVWQPAEVDADWRPYSDGHWEWTDVGWYWVSEEPWAWATYHYGSWIYDPTYGWVWIPGTEWAPAWVVWRESPDYIGWAPCGPRGIVLAPSLFLFVDFHHFHSHIHRGDFIVNDTRIINRTHVINNIRRVDRTFDGGVRRRVVVNDGPGVNTVERATGSHFTAQPLRELISHEPAPAPLLRRGSDLNIQRPALRESPRSGTSYRERQPIPRARERSAAPSGSSQQPRSVPPTGGSQQRTFPQERQPEGINPTVPQTTPPRTTERPGIQPSERSTNPRERITVSSGAEQPRISPTVPNQPARPAQVTPERREQSPDLNRQPRPLPPPTGREQPQIYPPPQPVQPRVPEQPRRVPEPPSVNRSERPAAVPSEKAAPPAERERRIEQPEPRVPQREQAAPPSAAEPRPPAERPSQPPGQERRDRDKDRP